MQSRRYSFPRFPLYPLYRIPHTRIPPAFVCSSVRASDAKIVNVFSSPFKYHYKEHCDGHFCRRYVIFSSSLLFSQKRGINNDHECDTRRELDLRDNSILIGAYRLCVLYLQISTLTVIAINRLGLKEICMGKHVLDKTIKVNRHF